MSNTKDSFLHKPEGETICFTDNGNGTVTVCWQRTLDPNEELDEEKMNVEEARIYWKQKVKQGYKKADGWHTCKRDSAWSNDYYRGDE